MFDASANHAIIGQFMLIKTQIFSCDGSLCNFPYPGDFPYVDVHFFLRFLCVCLCVGVYVCLCVYVSMCLCVGVSVCLLG